MFVTSLVVLELFSTGKTAYRAVLCPQTLVALRSSSIFQQVFCEEIGPSSALRDSPHRHVYWRKTRLGFWHTCEGARCQVAGLGANHLPVNHWLGVQVFASASAHAKQQVAISLPFSQHLCCYSSAANMIWSPVDSQLETDATTSARAADPDGLYVRVDSQAAYMHIKRIRVPTEVSGMVLTSGVLRYTHAALQLLSHLQHSFLHTPATPQLPAAVSETQPLVQWTDLFMDDVFQYGTCHVEDTLVSNESFTSHTNGANMTGDEMMSELSGRPSLPSSPDHDVKPLLDEVRSLEDTPINSVAEIASSFEDLPKDGKARDVVTQANQPHSETAALTPEDEDDDDKSQVDMCPLPYPVWLGELAGKVMEMYKEAWHSLAFRLHSAYRHCAASYALAIAVLKFLWKELCGDCRRAMQAATGDYSIVVVGCETLVLLLVATVMWMIRRLLRLERQLASSRLSSNIRHNASLKNHCCSRRITNDLESTTDKLKRGLNFAHRLLGNHHVRAGRRHKATKGSLSLLKRQQIKASRQRLTLKKQLRRALAQQSLLERQMERLQQILDVVLQVGRSLRNGNTAHAAELLDLKNHMSEQQRHTCADGNTIQQEMAHIQTQLKTEHRTQHLLESQGALIAELRSQLSAGQERQEDLITKVSSLEEAQAAFQAESAARPSDSFVDVPFTGQVADVSNRVGADAVKLDENGSALRSISQVETGRIPAVKVHHDNRGDYGMEEVERSALSYLSTTTTAPSTKPPRLTVPPSNLGSFSMPAKASRFQQHDDVFSRINSGMDMGSPKGQRAPRVGNPFAPGLTPAASMTLPVAQKLTPAASQTLPAGVEFSAFSAATSSAPLLRQGEGADSQAADSVAQSGTGPDDFASMGDSVAKLVDLFDYQHSAEATQLEPEAWQTLAQQLKVAVLHLFPFVSSRYQNALADLEHHESRTRGLVIPCGTSDFHFALHLVAAVRHVFNSTLPIEVMYAGDSNLSEDQRDALESVGTDIRLVDILHFFDEDTVGLLGGGWAIKPFAVLASSFEQVIIADSDVVFLQTPEAAFSHPGYISTGTLYFHDRIVPGSNDVHNWRIRSEATYRLTLGDKESYWMAFELAKIPYFFDDVYASAIGHVTKSSTDQKPLLCPSHLLHLDHQGKPLWYNGSLYRSKRAPKPQRLWMNPVVWAPDTGVWDGTNCMLEVEEHGGPHEMSDGGWDKVYKDTVQIATQWDAKYDTIIV
ncbi:hypothetical protein WJX79_008758 [Trebouxia sp. C0005]